MTRPWSCIPGARGYFLWTVRTGTPSCSAAGRARNPARGAPAALCLDFDGTLAPIVDDPIGHGRCPEGGLLGALAARFAAVA